MRAFDDDAAQDDIDVSPFDAPAMEATEPYVDDETSIDESDVAHEDDLLFHATWAALDAPADRGRRRHGLSLITLALFALVLLGRFEVAGIVGLIGVLFLHEFGHYAAMRCFGYTDLNIFFIPFFGAAAMGKKYAAPGWQQAIVILAGPLPGILLAGAILFGRGLSPQDPVWLRDVLMLLLLVNAFNLLPILPLDGGQLLGLLIFSRHPVLEAAFRLFAGLAAIAIAWVFQSWIFVIIAGGMLFSLTSVYRQGRARQRLRNEFETIPAQLTELDSDHRVSLYEEARHLHRSLSDQMLLENGRLLPDCIRVLHERLVSQPPGRVMTGLLLGVWLAAIVFTPACLVKAAWDLQQVGPMRLDEQTLAEIAQTRDQLELWTIEAERSLGLAQQAGDAQSRQQATDAALQQAQLVNVTAFDLVERLEEGMRLQPEEAPQAEPIVHDLRSLMERVHVVAVTVRALPPLPESGTNDEEEN